MIRRCESCADPDGCTELAVRGSFCAAHADLYLVRPRPLKMSTERIQHIQMAGANPDVTTGTISYQDDRVREHLRQRAKRTFY